MLTPEIKQEAYRFCENFIAKKLFLIRSQISELRESLSSETKSSAGDKHETGRAMLQIQREKLGYQLQEAERMEAILGGINAKKREEQVCLGALLHATSGIYFVAIAAGILKRDDLEIFCISPQAPIGKVLLGSKTGDLVVFRGQQHRILQVI